MLGKSQCRSLAGETATDDEDVKREGHGCFSNGRRVLKALHYSMVDVVESRATTDYRPVDVELAMIALHLSRWVILLRNNDSLPTGKNKDE
jgi:hypothetical protein